MSYPNSSPRPHFLNPPSRRSVWAMRIGLDAKGVKPEVRRAIISEEVTARRQERLDAVGWSVDKLQTLVTTAAGVITGIVRNPEERERFGRHVLDVKDRVAETAVNAVEAPVEAVRRIVGRGIILAHDIVQATYEPIEEDQ